MFGNFLYYIVVLLVYAAYQPSADPFFSAGETFGLTLTLVLVFTGITRYRFHRTEARSVRIGPEHLDSRLSSVQLQLSVLAVVFLGLQIYLINLVEHLSSVPLIGPLPTFQALMCLVLFTGYLSVIWALGYRILHRHYPMAVSRRNYVWSNISFGVPALIPWLLVSTTADILTFLPFEAPRWFLETPGGQVVYVALFLIAVTVFGPVLIQRFWRCTPLMPGPARSRIATICRQAGVGYRDILQWPLFGGHMLTAAVMGVVSRFRYILVTRSLLQHLQDDEIAAVIAHEAGHVRKKHLLFYLLFFMGIMVTSYLAFDLVIYLLLYAEPVYRLMVFTGISQTTVTSILFTLFMVGFFLLYFRYLFGYFMRNFERQADAFAVNLVGSAAPLVSTFRKIARYSGQAPDKPNWHHFSIQQRIDFLAACDREPLTAVRHDRKIKRHITLFLLVLIATGIAGYQLNFGAAGKTISAHLMEQILLRQLTENQDNPKLYAMLGDGRHAQKRYGAAIAAYEKALSLAPDAPHVLNNLAWLYATCEDPAFRNPIRASMLAQKAVAIAPSAELFDTLAESHFINGHRDAAVKAAARALDMAVRNREYYQSQLQKFRKAPLPAEPGA